MLFDLDIPKLVERSLLVHLRRPKLMAFVRSLLKPAQNTHGELMAVRDDIIAQYQYNGLKHSLEAMLNDAYDPIDRRIYITVPGRFEELWYQELTEQPIAWFEETEAVSGFIWNTVAELNSIQGYTHEFMVNVPVMLPFDPDEMFDRLDVYRWAGKRPAIRTFGAFDTTFDIYLYPNA